MWRHIINKFKCTKVMCNNWFWRLLEQKSKNPLTLQMTIKYPTMSQRILCAWKQAWYHDVVCMKTHLSSCRPSLKHLVSPFTIYVHGFIPKHRFRNIIHFFVFPCIQYCLWCCTYVNMCSKLQRFWNVEQL